MTQSIAVIGSGIAGLSAAYGCRQAGLRASIFEAHADLGMAVHSMSVDGGLMDAPLRIMSEESWGNTLALARQVGVDTYAIEIDVSCSWSDRQTWFRSRRMPITGWPMSASWRHLNLRAARLGLGMAWLSRLTERLQRGDREQTLDEVLRAESPDPLFWRGLILPILLTICTCDEEHVLAWPAAPLLAMLRGILHTGKTLRLRGGTLALARALARDIPRHVGSEVAEVRQTAKSVIVRNARGEGGRFDRVIIATQANQLDFLDAGQFGQERQVLQGIPYAPGELLVHRDERFLPRLQREWTALNFQMDKAMQRATFSVWVNAVDPTLMGKAPLFQTWNPQFEAREDLVIARLSMQRAVVNAGTAAVLEQLQAWHQVPERRVFYCGSWAHEGVPLLESAVRSSAAVVGILQQQSKRA